MQRDRPVPGIPGAGIRYVTALPAELSDAEPAGPFAVAAPGRLLLDVPNIARILVSDGTTVEVAVAPGADPGAVTLLVNGAAHGALILQRGELALHASTLVPPGENRGLALCGISGAGKSTLARELSRRGWTLLADDTTRVTWSGEAAVAWPSGDSIKLWRDACEAANVDPASLERVAASLDKYYLPVPAHGEEVALATVVELLSGRDSEPAESLAEKMALLLRNTTRPSQIRPLGRSAEFARIVGNVAGACRFMQLRAARTRTPAELADIVEAAAFRHSRTTPGPAGRKACATPNY